MTEKVQAALGVLDDAILDNNPSNVFALFSGGHDSLSATAVAAKHPAFSGAVHLNTGIGIPETREFVRETCAERGWPLLEYEAGESTYDDLVLGWGGFPSGPLSHARMYQFLKRNQLNILIRQHKRFERDRVMLVTGIRRLESHRRLNAGIGEPIHRDGAKLWVNPILDWSKSDCNDLIEREGLKRNPVVDLLHRSGECLCGAFARQDEILEIELWFPHVAERIHALEERAREAGLDACVWARRTRREVGVVGEVPGPLCSDCAL